MNFIWILLPVIFISIVQTANAQSPFDIINESVNDQIENTFDSVNDVSNSTDIGQGENNSESTSTTTTTTSDPTRTNSTTTTMKTNN